MKNKSEVNVPLYIYIMVLIKCVESSELNKLGDQVPEAFSK